MIIPCEKLGFPRLQSELGERGTGGNNVWGGGGGGVKLVESGWGTGMWTVTIKLARCGLFYTFRARFVFFPVYLKILS